MGTISTRNSAWWAAGALLLVHSLLVVRLMSVVGPTIDEPTYFNTGRVILNQGWEHPVTRLQGPLPYYANQLLIREFPAEGFRNSPDRDALFFRGRLGLLPFSLLLGAVIFAWSRRVFGDAGGLFALACYAFQPLMLAYAGLLAVDIAHCAGVLLALWAGWLFLQAPRSGGRGVLAAAGVGAALGFAFATKYLATLVAPWIVLALAWSTYRNRRAQGAPAGRALGAALVPCVVSSSAALLVLHAAYGFQVGFASLDPGAYASAGIQRLIGLPLIGPLLALFPAPYLLGVDFQLSVGEAPHLLPYLNGRFAESHPGYYLWSFITKTPEWFVAISAWLLLICVPRWFAGHGSRAERSSAWILLPPILVACLYLSFATGLQIGIRYVLPIYPVLIVLAGATVPAVIGLYGTRAAAIVGVVVLGWHAIDLGANWPNLLAYFNVTSGGQDRAYHRFRDSNAEWGQYGDSGLELLREETDEPFEELSMFSGPRFGRVAIQLRHLVRPLPRDAQADWHWLRPDRFRHWLEIAEPVVARAGCAWWLFEVTHEAWEEYLRDFPDRPDRRFELALAYVGSGRIADARSHAERLEPEQRELLERYVSATQGATEPGAGDAEIRDAIEAWRAMGRLDRIVELLKSTPLSSPVDQLWLLADTTTKQGRLDEAVGLLEASELSDPRLIGYLGELYSNPEVRRLGDSVRLFEQLHELYPEDARILRRLEEIRRELDSERSFLEGLKRRPR